jgi:hypothetical protein
MADADSLRELDTELARVVDRLSSLPLTKVALVRDDCHETAVRLVEETRRLTDDIPVHAEVPRLEPQGVGALIAVLGRDYREAAKAAPESDVSQVVAWLVELRRSLP